MVRLFNSAGAAECPVQVRLTVHSANTVPIIECAGSLWGTKANPDAGTSAHTRKGPRARPKAHTHERTSARKAHKKTVAWCIVLKRLFSSKDRVLAANVSLGFSDGTHVRTCASK